MYFYDCIITHLSLSMEPFSQNIFAAEDIAACVPDEGAEDGDEEGQDEQSSGVNECPPDILPRLAEGEGGGGDAFREGCLEEGEEAEAEESGNGGMDEFGGKVWRGAEFCFAEVADGLCVDGEAAPRDDGDGGGEPYAGGAEGAGLPCSVGHLNKAC